MPTSQSIDKRSTGILVQVLKDSKADEKLFEIVLFARYLKLLIWKAEQTTHSAKS
jgi:hypothetical protein